MRSGFKKTERPAEVSDPESQMLIEAFFLDSDGPEFELIRDAYSRDAAWKVACEAMENYPRTFSSKDLLAVVEKIRDED